MPSSHKVLLVGNRTDADLTRAALHAGYDFVTCEPDQAEFSCGVDDHFDFVVSSGLPAQAEIETAVAARWPLVILLEADDATALTRIEQGAFVVVRGPAMGLQLRQATRVCATKVAKQNFIRAVEGPLVHDLRGLVGLVDLSARLLGSAGDLSSSRENLLNACRRISWWLGDLGAHLLLRLAPEQSWPRRQGTNWSEVLSSRVADLALDYPRRILSVTFASRPSCSLSPEHMLVVLQGILEAALKTTASAEGIHFLLAGEAPEELSLTITAERSSPSAVMTAVLDDPDRWPSGPGPDVPFHFISGVLMARATGGSVTVEWLDQQLLAVARWPAQEFTPALA